MLIVVGVLLLLFWGYIILDILKLKASSDFILVLIDAFYSYQSEYLMLIINSDFTIEERADLWDEYTLKYNKGFDAISSLTLRKVHGSKKTFAKLEESIHKDLFWKYD